MSYILNGTTIKSPQSLTVDNDTQVAQNRSLDGTISRDYFGSNKSVWTLGYTVKTKADFDTINNIYLAYLSSGTPVTFESTETNYTIASTNVHVDLKTRNFAYRGDQYLSDFTLILTED